MSYLDQTKILVAKREDEEYPFIIAAMSMTTWEVVPQEDFDAWKIRMAKDYFEDDWTAYDYVEAIIEVPIATLQALFPAVIIPKVVPEPT